MLGLGDFYFAGKEKVRPRHKGKRQPQRQKATQLLPSFAFDCSTFAFDYPLLLATGHKAQKAKGNATFVLIFSPPPFAFALHTPKAKDKGGGITRSLTKAREATFAFGYATFAFGYATQRQKAKAKGAKVALRKSQAKVATSKGRPRQK